MKTDPNHTPLNILLADDDLDDCLYFEKALKEITIATVFKKFNNGDDLMDHLLKNTDNLPDVLFLDLSMPRKTGFECLSEIKENEKLVALPVIMLTTSFTRGIDFEDNLKATLTNMGASDYIRKPLDYKELKEILYQSLLSVKEKISSSHNMQPDKNAKNSNL